jgi:hypothetical protein
MQVPTKLRQNMKFYPCLSRQWFQRSFRPHPRPGHQTDAVAVEAHLVNDIPESIFLGATQNETRNDMGDVHTNQRPLASKNELTQSLIKHIVLVSVPFR